MRTVFLDANIYFSGALNPEGGSGFIIALAEKKTFFRVASSQYVINEALKNLKRKTSPAHATSFLRALTAIEPKISDPPDASQEILDIINAKDAPILHAAIVARADTLVTLDRKHFFDPAVLAYAAAHRLSVQTPKEFLQAFLREHGDKK